MEFTHGRRENRFYTEEEDEEDDDKDERNCTRGSKNPKIHPFLPITASASPSSSAIPLNLLSPSEPSTSATPAPTLPAIQKEPMFEKVVTPSDVGKLNRLVIPKQHAEKYFPLDAATHDRGLLLNFEDRNGKPWRFRYSYWNSSQSYVMTKGWSRFVKEKHLDAGDTVSFGRGMGETASHRLFIDWKRRPDPHLNPPNTLRIPRFSSSSSAHPHPYLSFARSTSTPWVASRLFIHHATPPPASNYLYFRSTSALAAQPNPGFAALAPPDSMVLDSIPVAERKDSTEPKRVRLFGVNLDQPREATHNTKTTGLIGLQLRSPFPSQDRRKGGNEYPFSAGSSSFSAKDSHHSPPFDFDVL